MSAKLKKDKREPVRIQLKKNDNVKVIAGRDRGKTGRILDVDTSTGRILVEKVNVVKRHTKKKDPTAVTNTYSLSANICFPAMGTGQNGLANC